VRNSATKSFQQQGFAIQEDVLASKLCDELSSEFDLLLQKQPATAGVRNLFQHSPAVCQLVRRESIRSLIEPILGKSAFAVRAILFDKSPDANWYVTWHQDTFIAVKERFDVIGFEAWSEKDSIPHTRPPATVLGKMVTVRLHLDPCDIDNGPLRVLPSSHLKGIMLPGEVAQLAETSDEHTCKVGKGGCVLMSPLLVHASSRAKSPARRRVLHLEFANGELPLPLEWYEQR